jgi:type IV secretion system protein TrbL
MGGTGVIDRFLEVFTSYIDSGFGLLGGDIAFLSSTLVAIDITLAGLFWALAPDEDIIARLIRKTLYVGFFAFLIGNFNGLAKIVFNSFAGLGLKASGSGLSADQFLQPGRVAQVGIDAGKPILEAASQLMGFVSFFENFVQIFVLLIAWLVVIVAFFILAVQLFITLIEFKLTTLAGFVLVPFGLFNKTAFLAERVLGNVIASGVKVLVLAVIVGIGTTLFGQFTQGFNSNQPTLDDVMALVLAALALLGLGIFGPGIASGLAAGAPQLGAGAAVGTALTAGGLGVAGVMGLRAGAGAMAGAVRGAAALGSGSFAGRSLATAGASSASNIASAAPTLSSASGPPEWAQRMRRHQAISHGLTAAAHAVRSGDHGGGSTSVSLSEDRK